MAAFADSRGFNVLLAPWKIISDRGLSGSFVAVFAITMVSECLKYYNMYRTYNPSQTRRNVISGTSRLRFLVTSTILSMVQNTLFYSLMLIAMTYNTWLFLAIVLGAGTAYLVFVPLLEHYMYKKDYINMLNRHYEPVTAT